MSNADIERYEYFINNRDRAPNEDPVSFQIQFPEFIGEYSPQTFLTVRTLTLANFIPLISEGVNDQLCYSYQNTNYVLKLVPDQYSIYDIINVLTEEFNSLNVDHTLVPTVAYDATQLKLSLTIPPDIAFSLTRPNAPTTISYTFPYAVDRLLEMLGWTFYGPSFPIPSNSTFIPTRPIRFNGTNFLHLNVNINMNSFSTSANNLQTIARIPVGDINYGELIHYEAPIASSFAFPTASFSILQFSLTDEWNNQVILPDTTSFAFHFALSTAPL